VTVRIPAQLQDHRTSPWVLEQWTEWQYETLRYTLEPKLIFRALAPLSHKGQHAEDKE